MARTVTMVTLPSLLSYALPAWLAAFSREMPDALATDEDAMRMALAAARRNVEEGTGGPFGALVVAERGGIPLAIGVNLVVACRASALHAEIVALLRAQQAAGSHDLSLGGTRRTTLYTSAEPCAMCLGAIPWSGVRRVVIAARDGDVRATGFDEGDKPADWVAGFARRGIETSHDVLRTESQAVLRSYADRGGPLY